MEAPESGSGTVRVSVSLAQYFSDERALCYMAAERARRAGWLARRVRRTFSLPHRVALRVAGRLLPPAEPLHAVLRAGDLLEVIPANSRVVDLTRYKPRSRTKLGPSPKESTSHSMEINLCGTSPAPSPVPSPVPCSAHSPVPSPAPSPVPSPVPSSAHSPVPSPAPSPAPSVAAADQLEEVKRRALALLAMHEPRGAPRRRRRVRRRRVERSPKLELAAESGPAPESDGDVLRNTSGARPARRVAALSPRGGGQGGSPECLVEARDYAGCRRSPLN